MINSMMLREPNNIFDEFFSFPLMDNKINYSFNPEIRTSESERDITIFCALPGAEKNKLKVETKNNLLSISYEQSEKENNRFGHRSFLRQWKIGDSIDQENITASYEDGILSVIMPKKEIEIRQITIS